MRINVHGERQKYEVAPVKYLGLLSLENDVSCGIEVKSIEVTMNLWLEPSWSPGSASFCLGDLILYASEIESIILT